jgi:arylsulfatase A-like enzyme
MLEAMRLLPTCALLVGLLTAADRAAAAAPGRKNVLFIAVDDLKPLLGAYGDRVVKTPHIDALARRGLVFERAYVQQAVCSPSRSSLMTGRRPDTTRVFDLQTHFRVALPDVVTLPQLFKARGYHAQALSKIYHGSLDDPQSWSVPHWSPRAPTYGPATQAALDKERAEARARGVKLGDEPLERDPRTGTVLRTSNTRTRVNGPPWEAADVADNAFADGMTADKAIELLGQLKDRPFFLAVGFLRPHLPFVAPKKYFDLYRGVDVPLARNGAPPTDVPAPAMHTSGELRSYKGVPKEGPLDEAAARDLVRAYYATTSYLDAQVGRLVEALDALGLRNNTIVALWGDHGWHLGDHGLWCKHTNFESATRAPLIIVDPGAKTAGQRTAALVEFVDIYPTLAELAGLPPPAGLEGTSLVPLVRNPRAPWKKAAFSQYPRGKDVMGYAMRTERYRYVEWRGADGKPFARELYDHATDPGENKNLASRPEHKALVARLGQQLAAGWRGALPPGALSAQWL